MTEWGIITDKNQYPGTDVFRNRDVATVRVERKFIEKTKGLEKNAVPESNNREVKPKIVLGFRILKPVSLVRY